MTREEIVYQGRIRTNAKHGIGQVIQNGRAEHAVQLMTAMFDFARRSILLFTGSLTPRQPATPDGSPGAPIYADEGLVTSATAFLGRKGTEFSVIAEAGVDGPDEHPLLLAIKRLAAADGLKGRFSISTLNVEYREQNPLKGRHFMLMDDQGYRLETSHEHFEAYANFNDQKRNQLLRTLFRESLVPNSAPIGLA